MFKLTSEAALQVRRAAGEAACPVLRVAARHGEDGCVDYGMGFDEWREGDVRVLCEGVAVVIAPHSRTLLERVTLDFVEIAPGERRFVFAARGAKEEVAA